MRFGCIVCCISVLVVMAGIPCLAQQPGQQQRESHKYRVIGTVAGGGGGFVLGAFAGIGMFDDAINSDRKVWTTALLAAAGGAVGGYFIGRALDRPRNKRRTPPAVTPWAPDQLDMSLMRARSKLFQGETGMPALNSLVFNLDIAEQRRGSDLRREWQTLDGECVSDRVFGKRQCVGGMRSVPFDFQLIPRFPGVLSSARLRR